MTRTSANGLVLTAAIALATLLAARPAEAQRLRRQRTAAYVTIGVGGLAVGVGVVFAALAAVQAARLEELSAMRDPVTGVPLVEYSQIEAVEAQRVLDTGLAIGFCVAGGVGLVTGTILAVTARGRPRAAVAVLPSPTALIVRVTF